MHWTLAQCEALMAGHVKLVRSYLKVADLPLQFASGQAGGDIAVINGQSCRQRELVSHYLSVSVPASVKVKTPPRVANGLKHLD